MTNLSYVGVLLFSVFISSVSQVILKKAALKKHTSIVQEYLNLYVIIAYSIFFAATLLTILAYRAVPLSLGALLESTSYVYVTLFGVIFFKEKITVKRLIALSLILIGIMISSFWG